MVSFSGISSTLKTTYGYVKRFAQATPELIFGTGSEAAGQAMRTAKQNGGTLFESVQAGWRAIEKNGKGSFFEKLLKNCKTFIPDMKKTINAGKRLAGMKSKSEIWGIKKGLLKGISKKLPFIGSMAMMLFELPNIFKATIEQGLFSGAKETVKAGARLTGGALGAAVGSAICPGIGSLIGWIAGEWLTSKVVGKSYSEQKAEEQEKYEQIAQQLTAAQQYQPQMQPQVQQGPFSSYGFDTNFGYNNAPYANDIMMQQMRFNKVA